MLRSTPNNRDLGRLRSFELFTRTFAENKSLHWSARRVMSNRDLTIRQRRDRKNVTKKLASYPFKLFRDYPRSACYLKEGNLGWS